jgi:hypothetical protein
VHYCFRALRALFKGSALYRAWLSKLCSGRYPPVGFNACFCKETLLYVLTPTLEQKPTGGYLSRNRVGFKIYRRVSLREQGWI